MCTTECALNYYGTPLAGDDLFVCAAALYQCDGTGVCDTQVGTATQALGIPGNTPYDAYECALACWKEATGTPDPNAYYLDSDCTYVGTQE
jgi:hypothetical protein